jgi:uncharacterized delta-60 repeat protein
MAAERGRREPAAPRRGLWLLLVVLLAAQVTACAPAGAQGVARSHLPLVGDNAPVADPTPRPDLWVVAGPLGVPRNGLAVAALGGALYAAGGSDLVGGRGGVLAAVERYDPADGTWRVRAPLPTRRDALAAAAAADAVFAIGGHSAGADLAVVERYDPASDAWTARAPMPSPRRGLAAASLGTTVYAAGGLRGGADLAALEAYDPAADRWTSRAPMPTARAYLALAAGPSGTLYALGGSTAGTYIATVEEYVPSANAWRPRAPMPTPRHALAAALGADGLIYAVGGYNGAGYAAAVEVYDPERNVWESRAALPSARASLGLATAGDGRLYAVGGFDGRNLLGVAAYRPAGAPTSPPGSGQLLIAGRFTRVNGLARRSLARLAADGAVDGGFAPALPGEREWVSALAVRSDRKVVLGVGPDDPGATSGYVARLNDDGAVDAGFQRVENDQYGRPDDAALQPDGRVVIVGFFFRVAGELRGGIARLLPDGGLDPTSRHGVPGTGGSAPPYALALDSDGRAVVVGGFGEVTGLPRRGIARLNEDGSLDRGFLAGLEGANGAVQAVALQSDGKVLIGGWFGAVNGEPRGQVARLNADGTLDRGFLEGLAGTNGAVQAIAVQPDGKVLIGGAFTRVNGEPRGFVARLNVDGSLDRGFLAGLVGTDGEVDAIAVQPDGRVLIGGQFGSVNGVARGRLARLRPDGALDATFLAGFSGPDGDVVRRVALVPDDGSSRGRRSSGATRRP